MSLGIKTSRSFHIEGRQCYRSGQPWRGIGVNFYDIMLKTNAAKQAAIQPLADHEIPFMRFNAGYAYAGSTPVSQWRNFLTDEAAWWGAIDAVVEAAENLGLGLIPSMFWRVSTIPDLMAYKYGKRDALGQIGVAGSNTRQFIADYTAKFINRYKHSAIIWGWELGNEYFTYAERMDRALMPVREGGPGGGYATRVDPAAANGTTDTITSIAILDFMDHWAATVLANDDSGRLLSTGNSVPSPVVYNSYYQVNPGQTDLLKDWMASPASNQTPWLIYQHPNKFNSICAHIYQDARVTGWWFNEEGAQVGPGGLISLCNELAKEQNKIFFLGEFGSRSGLPGQDGNNGTDASTFAEQQYFQWQLDTIVSKQIPIAACWNFGAGESSGVQNDNIDIGTTREYQLFGIADANASMAT